MEGRDTFSVKLTIEDIGTKNSILQNARKLQSTESLQKVYIKNDETRARLFKKNLSLSLT